MGRKAKKIEQLKEAIEHLHKCSASHEETVVIHEHFDDTLAWEGLVEVFSVDHLEADTCFAWSAAVEGSNKRRFYAVLKIPPVDSPLAAVRAAIVADHKAGRTP